jgi:hypothetical protein
MVNEADELGWRWRRAEHAETCAHPHTEAARTRTRAGVEGRRPWRRGRTRTTGAGLQEADREAPVTDVRVEGKQEAGASVVSALGDENEQARSGAG